MTEITVKAGTDSRTIIAAYSRPHLLVLMRGLIRTVNRRLRRRRRGAVTWYEQQMLALEKSSIVRPRIRAR